MRECVPVLHVRTCAPVLHVQHGSGYPLASLILIKSPLIKVVFIVGCIKRINITLFYMYILHLTFYLLAFGLAFGTLFATLHYLYLYTCTRYTQLYTHMFNVIYSVLPNFAKSFRFNTNKSFRSCNTVVSFPRAANDCKPRSH